MKPVREYQTSSWPTWLFILGVAPLIALAIAEFVGVPRDAGTLKVILLAETAVVICGVAVLVVVNAFSPSQEGHRRADWRSGLAAPKGTLLYEVSRHQGAWNSRVDGYLRKAWRGAMSDQEAPHFEGPTATIPDPFADELWEEADNRPWGSERDSKQHEADRQQHGGRRPPPTRPAYPS